MDVQELHRQRSKLISEYQRAERGLHAEHDRMCSDLSKAVVKERGQLEGELREALAGVEGQFNVVCRNARMVADACAAKLKAEFGDKTDRALQARTADTEMLHALLADDLKALRESMEAGIRSVDALIAEAAGRKPDQTAPCADGQPVILPEARQRADS